ncbi:hypothetical protein NEMBOFW57_000823 [Staphylotrichum longicolle]|uniref:SET domain-containing protein n=1 Tax=Staphylotrichum longicolle TaxID=669026 RepID=A0AAD4F0D9_9PEZI|nr:hypothetical protein NEMBOFW57_000823 [Staphylotrichum longicolle]
MVAQRPLQEGEDILLIPIDSIRSLHSIPKYITWKLPPDMCIHGLLAAELAVDQMRDSIAWRDVLPTLADFEAGLPFMWHEDLQRLLPSAARDILLKQQRDFHRDWSLFTKAFPDVPRDEYLVSWFRISTRTFSYETPQMETYPWHDRLALVPVADLFNHADGGCKVSYSPDGFEVCADRAYAAGQEVHISYGAHSNDFLLAEYGFVMAENRWDKVCLDDVILPKLGAAQRAQLEEKGLLGPFLLDAESLGCNKTQAALRLLCCTREQWQEFSLLDEYLVLAGKTLESIGLLQDGRDVQRELLRQRWEQIDAMVTRAIKRLDSRLD